MANEAKLSAKERKAIAARERAAAKRRARALRQRESKKEKKEADELRRTIVAKAQQLAAKSGTTQSASGSVWTGAKKPSEEVEIEYVRPEVKGSLAEEFSDVISRFHELEELSVGRDPVAEAAEEEAKKEAEEKKAAEEAAKKEAKEKSGDSDDSSDESSDEESEDEGEKLSRRERKKLRMEQVAVLKQLADKPELVEAWDVCAADPQLLVHLKGVRNAVAVPRHWRQKRKFLQNKRSIDKTPYQLPDFILATGIQKMRDSVREADDDAKLKASTRARVRPKTGKIDIDYKVLHDAFFRFQTKPRMTLFGDTYYEGKELEIRVNHQRPGHYSKRLKEALGMKQGSAPPWLINMQRYGPPPSYPNLKIAGLNAPIPVHEGAQWGYHPGGWGKAPVDAFGKPLYGDVFATAEKTEPNPYAAPIEKEHWGDIEDDDEDDSSDEDSDDSDEDSSDDDEEEEEDEEDEEEELPDGATSVSSMTSLPAGLATPETIDLRKQGKGSEDRQLFTVLQQREAALGAKDVLGSTHTYVMPGASGSGKKGPTSASEVELSLNPEDLNDPEAIKRKYEEMLVEKKSQKEDLSDMVEEHERKRRKIADKKNKKKFDYKF